MSLYRSIQQQLKVYRDELGYDIDIRLNSKLSDLLEVWNTIVDDEYNLQHAHVSGDVVDELTDALNSLPALNCADLTPEQLYYEQHKEVKPVATVTKPYQPRNNRTAGYEPSPVGYVSNRPGHDRAAYAQGTAPKKLGKRVTTVEYAA